MRHVYTASLKLCYALKGAIEDVDVDVDVVVRWWRFEPSPTNNHVLERPTNCDARGSILCATKLWRHSKWRWKDERPADRTKKHGSAFACVHRTPTRSQVAQEIRKRSSFVARNYTYYNTYTSTFQCLPCFANSPSNFHLVLHHGNYSPNENYL